MNTDTELTVAGAGKANEEGRLAAWVEAFPCSGGSDNVELGESLRHRKASWVGPIELPFDWLHRFGGPADQPTLGRFTDDDLDRVAAMPDEIDTGWEPAPLVVSINGDQLVLEDGNHRTEALRRSGRARYWCVVGFDADRQRDRVLGSERFPHDDE